MLPSKVCAGCANRKSWEGFYAKKKWPDGTMRQPQSRCKECMAEANRLNRAPQRKYDRKRYRRIRGNPVLWADHLERQRFDYRRRAGVTHIARAQPSVEIMAAPFGEWVRHVLARDEVTVQDLAARWGISDSTLYKVTKGQRVTVELATVEAALCADGTCLVSDLYDDQELAA